jgi:hypothetical protein
VTPAPFAYRQFFTFKLNVELNVSAFAATFPGIFTMLHHAKPHIALQTSVSKIAFKTHGANTIGRCGEVG